MGGQPLTELLWHKALVKEQKRAKSIAPNDILLFFRHRDNNNSKFRDRLPSELIIRTRDIFIFLKLSAKRKFRKLDKTML
jgi:hypothetical protein